MAYGKKRPTPKPEFELRKAQLELARLHKVLATLRHGNQALRDQLVELRDRLASVPGTLTHQQLTDQLRDAREALKARDEALSAQQATIHRLQDEKDELGALLKEACSSYQALQADFDREVAGGDSARHGLKMQRQAYERMLERLREAHRKIHELQAHPLMEVSTSVGSVAPTYRYASEELEEARREIERLGAQLNAVCAVSEENEQKLKVRDLLVETLREDFSAVVKDRNSTRDRLASALKGSAEMGADLLRAGAKVGRLQDEKAELEKVLRASPVHRLSKNVGEYSLWVLIDDGRSHPAETIARLGLEKKALEAQVVTLTRKWKNQIETIEHLRAEAKNRPRFSLIRPIVFGRPTEVELAEAREALLASETALARARDLEKAAVKQTEYFIERGVGLERVLRASPFHTRMETVGGPPIWILTDGALSAASHELAELREKYEDLRDKLVGFPGHMMAAERAARDLEETTRALLSHARLGPRPSDPSVKE